MSKTIQTCIHCCYCLVVSGVRLPKLFLRWPPPKMVLVLTVLVLFIISFIIIPQMKKIWIHSLCVLITHTLALMMSSLPSHPQVRLWLIWTAMLVLWKQKCYLAATKEVDLQLQVYRQYNIVCSSRAEIKMHRGSCIWLIHNSTSEIHSWIFAIAVTEES